MKFEKECYISSIKTDGYCGIYDYEDLIIEISIPRIYKKELKKLLKIQDNYKAKLTLEVEDPILDEVERKYLSDVIRPFRDKVINIFKYNNGLYESICITTRNKYMEKTIFFPPFEKETMYKGMKKNIEYSLKELGL